MKTIKIAFYKLESKINRKRQSYFMYKSFQESLNELATKLDGDTNRQVIDTNKNGLETSIWFDYINEKEYFNFDNIYYFLLAKDVSSIMKEDKKNNKLSHQNIIDDEIHLKIPAHFVYFPDKQVLGVEEIENAPSKSVIERAIKSYIIENVKFSPIQREDPISRLNTFLEAIESVEIDMKNFSSILKDIDGDEYLNFIRTNKSKLKIKTYLDTDKGRKYVFDIFSKLFNKNVENEILKNISNMSVKYKNEESQLEALSLIDNFLVFKKDREVYLEEFQSMEDNVQRRLKYSKSIYETIIDFYDEHYE
ncbi:hypothetical protein [Sulfurimonas sp.]|uniref:hypothetical protein n=1 Tax=Sulfurimonas sp. TaxID=2022749 RepID=UPI002B4852A3|nr:hypothetical protein [Sulfurimonas sp.]